MSAPFSCHLAVTVRLTLVECLCVRLVPVMVNVNVPVGVEEVVETVRVEVAGDGGKLNEAGLSVQWLCEGQPMRLRLTLPVSPFSAVTVAV